MLTWFLLGLALAMPEIIVVTNWPWLKSKVIGNPIIELVFSLLFGMLVAKMMSIPAGVSIAIGNIFSTPITMFWYKYDPPTMWKNFVVKMQNTRSQLRTIKNVVLFPVRPIIRLIEAGRWVNHQYQVQVVARAKRGQ